MSQQKKIVWKASAVMLLLLSHIVLVTKLGAEAATDIQRGTMVDANTPMTFTTLGVICISTFALGGIGIKIISVIWQVATTFNKMSNSQEAMCRDLVLFKADVWAAVNRLKDDVQQLQKREQR